MSEEVATKRKKLAIIDPVVSFRDLLGQVAGKLSSASSGTTRKSTTGLTVGAQDG